MILALGLCFGLCFGLGHGFGLLGPGCGLGCEPIGKQGQRVRTKRVRPVKERVGSSARDNDFRTLQLMCYKLRKHEDSIGEISASI